MYSYPLSGSISYLKRFKVAQNTPNNILLHQLLRLSSLIYELSQFWFKVLLCLMVISGVEISHTAFYFNHS